MEPLQPKGISYSGYQNVSKAMAISFAQKNLI
jgi:hypothetical protein